MTWGMGAANRNLLIYIAIGLVWLGITVHRIIAPAPPYEPKSSREDITRFAIETLKGVQTISIDRKREHCGVIVESEAGTLSASQIYDGRRAECEFLRMREMGDHVIASFHTHGGVDPAYDSEFPSAVDVAGDMEERIAGFVATPGGRVWRIDWRDGTAAQVCGAGCIAQDPGYDPTAGDTPRQSYTLGELEARYGPADVLAN